MRPLRPSPGFISQATFEVGSVRRRTSHVCGVTAETRPTSPSGTATAALSLTPSDDPRPALSTRMEPDAPPCDSTGANIHSPSPGCA